MDHNGYIFLIKLLILGSFACGPGAIAMAAHRTFGRAVAIIVLGIAAGIAAIAASFKAHDLRVQALHRAGEMPLNDMPGFGQALLFAGGLIYFAGVLAIVLAVSLGRWLSRRKGEK